MTDGQDIVERINQLPPYNNPATALAKKAAAHIEALEAQLAARDAEIAAWLRGQAALSTIFASDNIVANIANAIAAGQYRKDGE